MRFCMKMLHWFLFSSIFPILFQSVDIIPIHFEMMALSNEIHILIVLSVEQTNKKERGRKNK